VSIRSHLLPLAAIRMAPNDLFLPCGGCSKGVSPLVVFKDATVDHDRYIKEVLPVAFNPTHSWKNTGMMH